MQLCWSEATTKKDYRTNCWGKTRVIFTPKYFISKFSSSHCRCFAEAKSVLYREVSFFHRNVPHTAQAYLVKGIKNTHIGEGDSGENGAGRARPKWGGGEYCARCDKQVYIAERKQGAGNVSPAVCT